MKPYWQQDNNKIYQGHVLDILKGMDSESVHMVVTSPPYWGLRDYGIEGQVWDERQKGMCRQIINNRETFVKDGHEWGDVGIEHHPGQVQGNKAITNENAKEQTAGSGQFCLHCNAWLGSLGLEPTPELFIQHMVQIFREVKRVLRDDGTLWLNMGDGFKDKQLLGIPWMLAFALRNDGWYLRSDIIWHKPNPMPESVTDRPTKSHEYLFLLSKSQRYYYDAESIREDGPTYTRKAGGYKNHSNQMVDGYEPFKGKGGFADSDITTTGRNKRTVWTIPTQPFAKAHFATFPEKLIEPCILAGTSEKGCCPECGKGWVRVVEKTGNMVSCGHVESHHNHKRADMEGSNRLSETSALRTGLKAESKTIGWNPGCECTIQDKYTDGSYSRSESSLQSVSYTVLDPFFGSGTTGIVSHKHNRSFIGIELSKPYLDDIAIPRIEQESRQLKLFGT